MTESYEEDYGYSNQIMELHGAFLLEFMQIAKILVTLAFAILGLSAVKPSGLTTEPSPVWLVGTGWSLLLASSLLGILSLVIHAWRNRHYATHLRNSHMVDVAVNQKWSDERLEGYDESSYKALTAFKRNELWCLFLILAQSLILLAGIVFLALYYWRAVGSGSTQ